MRRILLTGFEPFNNLSTNPSQEIIFAIESEKIDGITTRILPVEFGKSSEILIGLIEKLRPDFVICLGQAEKSCSSLCNLNPTQLPCVSFQI